MTEQEYVEQREGLFEVILSNGDRAEADSLEAAVLAARTMIPEADAGNYYAKTTASFYFEGRLLRQGVRYAEVSAVTL